MMVRNWLKMGVVPLVLAGTCAQVEANVDLEWRPTIEAAFAGNEIRLGLYAVSDSASDQSLSSVRVVFTWDSSRLELLGIDNTGGASFLFSELPSGVGDCGLNESVPPQDGEGVYEAGTLGGSVVATPNGTLLTTFQFQIVGGDGASANVAAVMQSVSGTCSSTVIDGNNPGLDILGAVGSTSFIAFPEGVPAASGWGLVVLALLLVITGSVRGISTVGSSRGTR